MPKKTYFSPNPQVHTPSALRREVVTDDQVRWDEDTIQWGPDDALPLRIMDAVNRSPTTTACLDVRGSFIGGAGFSDPELEQMVVDGDGTTLIDFHRQIVEYVKLLDSFSVNFKLDQKGRITFSYVEGPDTCRFVKYKGTKVEHIKRNPYFGTSQYKAEDTVVYPVYDPAKAKDLIASIEDPGKFEGVMYYWGNVKPPYKHYSVPGFWSGEKWIYVDGEIQQFHKSNLQNGFFQSAVINVIGNPNQQSPNPKYQKTVDLADGTKRKQSTKTVGEEWNEFMNQAFSGARKAGTAMTIWSENENKAVRVLPFPVNSQFDVLAGTYTDAIKGICIATGIDPILLTIQGNSLVNSGDSIRAVIDYTQSKVLRTQKVLENFYNNIMLPNLQSKTSAKVEIKPYVPITTQVVIDQKFWDVLSDVEKKDFVKKNISGMVDVIKEVAPIVDENGEPLTPEEEILSDNLKDLNMKQIYRLNKISQQYAKGEINETQAVVLIKGFGFSDQEARAWLGIPVEGVKE